MKIKFYFLGKTRRKKQQQHFKMSPAENCSQGAIKVLYKSLLHIQTLHSFFFFLSFFFGDIQRVLFGFHIYKHIHSNA